MTPDRPPFIYKEPAEPPLLEPPPNPAGGRTLIVDAYDPGAYSRPSAALKDAGEDDQIFVRPGIYEDKFFVAERPILLSQPVFERLIETAIPKQTTPNSKQ